MRDRATGLGTVASVMGGGAIAWITIAASLPVWPGVVMGGVSLGALAMLFFGPSTKDALDKQIRRGIEARDRIIALELDESDADALYQRWFSRTHRVVHRRCPSYENRLMLADAPPDPTPSSGPTLVVGYSGSALVIVRFNAKIAVLQEARDGA